MPVQGARVRRSGGSPLFGRLVHTHEFECDNVCISTLAGSDVIMLLHVSASPSVRTVTTWTMQGVSLSAAVVQRVKLDVPTATESSEYDCGIGGTLRGTLLMHHWTAPNVYTEVTPSGNVLWRAYWPNILDVSGNIDERYTLLLRCVRGRVFVDVFDVTGICVSTYAVEGASCDGDVFLTTGPVPFSVCVVDHNFIFVLDILSGVLLRRISLGGFDLSQPEKYWRRDAMALPGGRLLFFCNGTTLDTGVYDAYLIEPNEEHPVAKRSLLQVGLPKWFLQMRTVTLLVWLIGLSMIHYLQDQLPLLRQLSVVPLEKIQL
jgi:hypothetical protein